MNATDWPISPPGDAAAADRRQLAERLHALNLELSRRSGNSAFGIVERSGLGVPHVKALQTLGGCELTVGDLAARLGVSQPTASRIVGALRERGLVDCTVSEADRRARTLSTSEEGARLLERLSDARTADLRIFAETLTDEQAARLSEALAALDLGARR